MPNYFYPSIVKRAECGSCGARMTLDNHADRQMLHYQLHVPFSHKPPRISFLQIEVVHIPPHKPVSIVGKTRVIG